MILYCHVQTLQSDQSVDRIISTFVSSIYLIANMSDVQNLLCVVARTLPNVLVLFVNLIVSEGLDTPNNMY